MTDQQEAIALVMVLRPFGLLVILTVLYPVRWSIQRYMPDCKLKRLLLYRLNT